MGFWNRITCNPTVCCGCIQLRGGTLLLLWLNVLIAVITSMPILGYVMRSSSQNGSSSNSTHEAVSYLSLIMVLLYGISSALGLCAIQCNKSPSFFRPYLYLTTIDMTISAFVAFLATVWFSLYYTFNENPQPDVFVFYFIGLLILMLRLHLFSVVYRYYERLKAEDNASGVPYQQHAIP